MQIDRLVREGRRPVSGMTGLCPSRTKPPMWVGFYVLCDEGGNGGEKGVGGIW